MNIAIDARFYGLEHAGLGRYTLNLINELAKIDEKNIYTLFVFEKYKYLDLPPNFETVVVNAKHHSIAEQVKLPLALTKKKFDLVHFPHFIVPILNFKVPFIVTIHDLIKSKFDGKETTTLPYSIFWLKNKLYRFDMNWAVNKSKAIITPTDYVKYDIVSHYDTDASKIYAIHEGVDTHLLNYNDTQRRSLVDGKYILFVGKPYVHKNVETLIKTLEFLPEDIKLVIAGAKGVFWDRVVKRVNRPDLMERVKHLGFVDDDDLPNLYKHAIAFVSASLEEGFGLPPLEAMALGCPTIVSDIPVHREVCDEASLFFDPHSPKELARLIVEELINDPSLRTNLIDRGLDNVKRFSWEKMAREILKVYENKGGAE